MGRYSVSAMESSRQRHIQVIEGAALNYIKAFYQHFGGEMDARSYRLKHGKCYIDLKVYLLHPGLELLVNEAVLDEPIVVDRLPDGDPGYFHINLFKEGRFTQSYSNEHKQFEAGVSQGLFLYNGLFPLKAEFPALVPIKTVGYKLNKQALAELLPEAVPLFDALFPSQDGVAYHTHLQAEVDRLTDDLFHFRDLPFGNRTMVMARGLEAFTSLMRAIKELVDKDQLKGLHVDDYQRLLRIKTKLLGSFEQKVSLEGLADEFGISVAKLKRDFKTLFDCSIYQFYTHSKMDEAFRRLKTGNYSVMEVGYDLGYQNLSKFSEMFKKVKGISPREVVKLPGI